MVGCASGEIFLWHFGQSDAVAGYTSLAASSSPAPAGLSLFSTPARSWSTSTLSALGHWGQPQAVCMSLLIDCLKHLGPRHMRTLHGTGWVAKLTVSIPDAFHLYFLDVGQLHPWKWKPCIAEQSRIPPACMCAWSAASPAWCPVAKKLLCQSRW